MSNLDKILKQQMESFAPDAPNIWAGIEQGIQANAATQTALVGKSLLVKTIITAAKIAAILVIPTITIVYFVSNKNETLVKENKIETAIVKPNLNTTNTPIITEKISDAKETENSNKIVNNRFPKANKPTKQSEAKNEKAVELGLNNTTAITQSTPLNKIENKVNLAKVTSNQHNDEDNEQKEEELIAAIELKNEEKALGIVRIPNVFTPNNDGVNDKYLIELEGEKFYNLKIYNYDNELVFESNDKNNNWDGVNYKTGQVCGSGIYYGILLYKLSDEDKNLTQMTRIKLIR